MLELFAEAEAETRPAALEADREAGWSQARRHFRATDPTMAYLAELAEEAEADPFAWPEDVTGPFDLEWLRERSDEDVVNALRPSTASALGRADVPNPQPEPPGHHLGPGHL
jgi:hypothetical protein